MADGVLITAGSGTVVSTDQLADNTHVQRVKLMDGTADSTAVIAGDATDGLDIDVGGKYTTPTHTAVSVGVATTVALASNTNRRYALFINNSNVEIYLKLGVAAVLNQGIRLNRSGGSYEVSRLNGALYTGAVNAIASVAASILLVTEGV